MAKITIGGVFSTRKKLADGSVREYWYHRATGARLPGAKGSAEFLAAYIEAEKLAPINTNNVAALIRTYLLSKKFESKSDSTKSEYKRMLVKLEERFGKLPIAALASPKVRAVFLDYQQDIGADRPREADNRLTVLSAVFSHARARGLIKDNPLYRFERLYRSERSEIIWTAQDVDRFMNGAPVELQRALILAIHTGQRYGDLVRLRWSDFDGRALALKQSKGKRPVYVPCTPALLAMLANTPRVGPYILTRADGRPWFTANDDKALSKAWKARMIDADFYPAGWGNMTAQERKESLRFHDLRGTAVTLLAEAGATIPQISAITGHTLQSVTRILERYLAMTRALSEAAIVKFQNAPETNFANRLQTGADPMRGDFKKSQGDQ